MKRPITPPPFFSPRKLREYAAPPSDLYKAPSRTTSKSDSSAVAFSNGQSVMKIMSWNCDGLLKYISRLPTGLDTFVQQRKESTPITSFLADLLRRHEPDMMCMQEVHLWEHELKQVTRQLLIDAPDYKFHSCLPIGIPCPQSRRQLFLGIEKVDSENDFKDPMTGNVRGTRSQRKREFDTLLANEMQAETSTGKQVLLLGDLNISRYPIDALGGHLRTAYPHNVNREHFNTVFSSYRDIIRERFPNSPKFSWFSRITNSGASPMDKARVDIILVNEAVQVVDADTMEDPVDRAQSDHGPLFVRVKYELENAVSPDSGADSSTAPVINGK